MFTAICAWRGPGDYLAEISGAGLCKWRMHRDACTSAAMHTGADPPWGPGQTLNRCTNPHVLFVEGVLPCKVQICWKLWKWWLIGCRRWWRWIRWGFIYSQTTAFFPSTFRWDWSSWALSWGATFSQLWRATTWRFAALLLMYASIAPACICYD